MKSCIYPGSFDPLTLGHINVVERASALFDKVIVAVGNNDSKKYTFSAEARLSMVKTCVSHLKNVTVTLFHGLLADFAYESGCKYIIKGVRNFQDFDYERLLNDVGLSQQRGIETITIFSTPALSHVSSSVSKELCKNHGLIDGYVPLSVKQKMELEFNKYFVFGVTGECGVGKSYFCNLMEHLSIDNKWLRIKHIDLDKIGYEILHTRTEQVYLDLRESIISEFDLGGNSIDRKRLGDIVFNDSDSLNKLNEMMRIPILTRIRKELESVSDIRPVMLNGALLSEAGFLTLCNNNVMVIMAPREKQRQALKNRGLSDSQIDRRINSQLNTDGKINLINDSISKNGGHGQLHAFMNYEENIYDKVREFGSWVKSNLV